MLPDADLFSPPIRRAEGMSRVSFLQGHVCGMHSTVLSNSWLVVDLGSPIASKNPVCGFGAEELESTERRFRFPEDGVRLIAEQAQCPRPQLSEVETACISGEVARAAP